MPTPRRRRLTQGTYLASFEHPMRDRGPIDPPPAASAYLGKCIAGDDLPVEVDDIRLLGSFRGPAGSTGHLLYGWGETRQLVLVVDLSAGSKILGDYTFDRAADYGLYDLPRPPNAMKSTAVARAFKHGAKVIRRKRPTGSAYEVRCWGPPPHDLLRGLDDVFRLTFAPQHAHQLAATLANPAVAAVEGLYAQELDFPVPTDPELWPTTIRELQLGYKKRGKHALVIPPVEGLESLFANSCTVKDLRDVASVPALQRLYLSSCEVESLDGLEMLAALRSLTVFNDTDRAPLRDISALAGLVDLEELSLTHATVADLEALADLRKLRKLELHGLSNIASVASLENLSELRELSLHGSNRVTSLEPLGALERLERLDVMLYPPRSKSIWLRSTRDLQRFLTPKQPPKKRKKATKNATAQRKKKAPRKAVVFCLDELSALPDLTDVCCHVARGGQRHRPAREYLKYTYVVASGQRPVKLPKEDPSIPVDDDFPPGFVNGLIACIQDLPGLVRPRSGQWKCYVASHCSASPEEIAEFLTGSGYAVLRVADLLSDGSAPPRESWDAFDAAATAEVGPGLVRYLRDGSTPRPKALPSPDVVARLPLKLEQPERWDERDRRAAKLFVSLGSPESLLPDIGAYPWESPTRFRNAWVDAMHAAGLPKAKARALLLRHDVSKSISPGLSDSLGLLAQRQSLAEQAHTDPALKSQLRFGMARAIKIIARTTGARLPTTELLAPFQ